MDKVLMSEKELDRVAILDRVATKEITVLAASKKLKLSLRQTRRLLRRFETFGSKGLQHSSRGRESNRKISQEVRDHVRKLIIDCYQDFGPSLIMEQLTNRHDLRVSHEWIRQLMIKEGLWKSKKAKRSKVHGRRPRRSSEGELIQIDGSYHDWFEGRDSPCCLLVAIDDATGKLQELRFVDHESTRAYFEMMKAYISRYGLPAAIYTDRHSVFKMSRKEKDACEVGNVQFARAMEELGIELIHARSPQAKGRVERANGTLQDRLVKLMRLAGISDRDAGNEFLRGYLEQHNERYSRQAQNEIDVHRSVGKMDVNRILVRKETRKISKCLALQFEGRTLQLKAEGNVRRLTGKRATIIELSDGQLIIEVDGREYKHQEVHEPPLRKSIMDDKELRAFLDRKPPLTAIQRRRRGMGSLVR